MLKIVENLRMVGTPLRTPLGELTALTRPVAGGEGLLAPHHMNYCQNDAPLGVAPVGDSQLEQRTKTNYACKYSKYIKNLYRCDSIAIAESQ